MSQPIFEIERGEGPIVATAVHDGHQVREELVKRFALSDAERLREEDPFTGSWTLAAPTRVIGLNSRFEVDLNRGPELAVYQRPEDAWGLQVWRTPLPEDVVGRSLDRYRTFYTAMQELLEDVASRHRRFVVLDLHSYNHRRGGPTAGYDDPEANPQVNLGTESIDRRVWSGVLDRFASDLRNHDFPGGPLDVRENVKFTGGYFPRWINQTFAGRGCAIAVEFKKFFMDEWTGKPLPDMVAAITAALTATVPGILEELDGHDQDVG